MASGTIKAVVGRSDIVDNLTTNDDTKVLSAKQGKILSDQIATSAIGNSPIDIASNTDLNTLQTPGYYKCNTSSAVQSLSHCPVQYVFTMQVLAGSGNVYTIQELTQMHDGHKYRRTRSSTTWTDWVSLDDKIAQFDYVQNDVLTSLDNLPCPSMGRVSFAAGINPIGTVFVFNFVVFGHNLRRSMIISTKTNSGNASWIATRDDNG